MVEKTTAVASPVDERAKEPPPGKISYDEFLAWADEDTWAEWVDGDVIMVSPASPRHQRVSRFLLEVMSTYASAHELGEVFPAPMQMKLERGREPDVLFVAREHSGRLVENRLEGPADVVVEIVSPESVSRDWRDKYHEYERGGVREYWLIDLDHRWAEFYRLNDERWYETVFAGSEGIYRSAVLEGFWLRVEWLWQEPLPDTQMIAWEILGYENVVHRLAQAIGVDEVRRLLREWDEQGQGASLETE